MVFFWTSSGHRDTEGSCNLIVEVSRKHIIAPAQNLSRTHTDKQRQACTDTHRHTYGLSKLTRMRTCIAYQNVHRNRYTAGHKGTARTHSISLNDRRLTRIDHLIFLRVCGSVKAHHRNPSPYSSLSTAQHISETDFPISLFFSDFLTLNAQTAAVFTFLYRLNELESTTKASQSIKSGPSLQVSLEYMTRE